MIRPGNERVDLALGVLGVIGLLVAGLVAWTVWVVVQVARFVRDRRARRARKRLAELVAKRLPAATVALMEAARSQVLRPGDPAPALHPSCQAMALISAAAWAMWLSGARRQLIEEIVASHLKTSLDVVEAAVKAERGAP